MAITPNPLFKGPLRSGAARPLNSNVTIELISPSNKSYDSWWAPETRTEVRTIMIDPRQGEIISEFMDYQRGADPTGVF
jgi:hypothetical protein